MSDTPAPFIRVPPSGLSDLAAVAVNADALENIVTLATKAGYRLDIASVARAIAKEAGLEARVIVDVLDGLTALRGLMGRFEYGEEQVVAGIIASLEVNAPDRWRKLYQDKWIAAKDKISAALKLIVPESPLALIEKARELTYAHEHVLTDVRLITDMRPVFNTAGDQVQTTVITHVLAIDYQDGPIQKRIEFALDAADVAKLRRISERSQRKAASLRSSFEKLSWSLIIPGSPEVDNEGKHS